MIHVTSIRNCKRDEADARYAIVRSYKRPIQGVEHMPLLSPSPALFHKYLSLRDAGQWGKDSFKEIYVPQFLRELAEDRSAVDMLNGLYRRSRTETIVLACFCPDESLCHRSIVAGLLQGAGAEVRTETGTDYSEYYGLFKAYQKEMGA